MKGFGGLYKDEKKKNKPPTEKIINQAIQLHLKGNITEATRNYKQLISQECNDERVFSNYGVILQGLGKLKDAELSYRKAIELNPNYAVPHSNLGIIFKDLGKLKDAELSTRTAIELDPNYAEAHYNLGIIFRDLGKLKDAELSTRTAIELNPNYAIAHSNLGIILMNLGKLKDAELSTRKAIELNPDYAIAHSNLANILRDLGKLQDAELSTRKAIELNPNYANAHSNLGIILMDLGKLQDAEKSYRKAIELNPNFAEAYYSLSLIQYSDSNEKWQNQLFSGNILKNKSQKDQVNIYFARANLLHKRKKYKESSSYLELANNLKLDNYPSNSDNLIKQSKKLLIESEKKDVYIKQQKSFSESIFIVGMPRCGSTLVESILSMKNDVYDLGESKFLSESFKEFKNYKQDKSLDELYRGKINNKTKINITTNKNLYNFLYAGIIANQIANAKIIHCIRHPLDNILSIYRANFTYGNEYCQSLVDCAKVYLVQDEIMTNYKNRFRSKIYNLNYESLVRNPNQEIKSLISWLGWKWDDSYLSPHLNQRSVSTASKVQVRSPINSKSIDGWKNYKEMLRPVIEIFTKVDSFRDLIL